MKESLFQLGCVHNKLILVSVPERLRITDDEDCCKSVSGEILFSPTDLRRSGYQNLFVIEDALCIEIWFTPTEKDDVSYTFYPHLQGDPLDA